ncbi:MAG: serine hydrolase domain-containing protein [Cyanobacteria bacterium P01_C01_bin.72]
MCKPCSDFNVNLTYLKDQKYVGTISDVDSKMSSFLESNNILGGALGIVKNNEISYLKTYGNATLGNPEAGTNQDGAPFTIGTPSNVGSISKTLTALGILRLYERGYLDLDDTVSQYMPFIPSFWQAVSPLTIRELLSHQSGIRRDPVWGFPSTEEQLRSVFTDAGEHPGIEPRYAYWGYRSTPNDGFESGSTARYSNTGYALLGAVIDFITQRDEFDDIEQGYENFVWWNVGMKSGTISGSTMNSMCLNAYWRQSEILNLALDYPTNSSFRTQQFTGWEGPPGGWTMTIGDLARLMIMINTNQIIKADTKVEMMTNYGNDFNGVGSAGIGLGVFLSQRFGEPTFLHNGSIGNYTARYVMWPEDGLGIALMINGSASLTNLSYELAEMCRNTNSGGIVFADADIQQTQTAVYRLVAQREVELVSLVQAFQAQHGDLEKAIRAAIKVLLGDETGKKLIRNFTTGDFEQAAQLALRLLEQSSPSLSGPSAELGPYNLEQEC